MEELYLVRNTDSYNRTANPVTNSPSFFAKKKQSKIKFIISFLSLFVILFLGNKMTGQTTISTTGTGSGTWTVPCDVSSIVVQAWGPGGKGGDATGKSKYGSGGGSGGYTTSTLSVTPGQVISFTVGAGNTTTNTNISTLVASYGTTGGSDGGAAGLGGSSSGGSTNTTGSPGIVGNATISGAGGNCPSGGTGGAGITSDNNGNNGNFPGGGGGGGNKGNSGGSNSGGNGGDGQIKITYTSSLPSYCATSFTSGTEPITNVTFAGINNTTTNITGGSSYESFCSTGSVIQGSATNTISIKGNTNGSYTNYVRVYIDWDRSGVFGNVANEIYDLGTIVNSNGIDAITLTSNIAVPATAAIGNTRMRVMKNFNAYPTGPCQTGAGYGQAEDYFVNVVAPASCTTPTTQPTSLILTSTSSTINGSFTLASPAVDNYLVVRSTSASAPTPADGVTYAIGSTALGGSNVVVDTDNNNTFSATGLTANTVYYLYIFSYNSVCSGGPKYLATSPLNGSTNTSFTYCSSTYTTGTTYYISNVTVAGINNNSTNSEGLPMYADYTAQTGNVIAGNSYTFTGKINTGSNPATVFVWLDWNKDGVLNDAEYPAGERYTMSGCNSGSSNCTVNGTIVVPAGASVGNTRMRVSVHRDADALAGTACQTTLPYGETEGYTINVAAAVVCVKPTAQPSALILTPAGSTITGSFTNASPSVNNYLVVISTVNSAPSPVDGTTYTIGNTIGSSTVVDTDSDNAFTATGLSQLSTYYVFVFSYNSLCSGGPVYNTTSPLNGNSSTLSASYCTPTGNLNCTANDFISNVAINTLNNPSNCSTGGYANYAATGTQTTSLTKGTSYNFSLKVGAGTGTHGAGVWIDFNQNGVFSDPGEFFLVSNAISPSTTNNISIPIPVGATTGITRMRVRYAYATTVGSGLGLSCTMNGTYGETEDYTITLVNVSPCVVPAVQPTALMLTPNSNSIGGSFTYASPTANNYLVTISTANTPPSPVNGTTYIAGNTIGSSIVVDVDSNNTFLANGLSTTTTYYIYVFSYNSLCSGGPLYNTSTPLSNTATTLTASPYCVPSVSSTTWANWDYISNVSFVGTLNETSNNSTYSTTPLGYQDFTGLVNKPSQAQGEGVNIFVQAKNTSFIKAWVDWNRDGVYADPSERVYDTKNIATYSTTFGFIIPPSTSLGDYRIRIRINSKDTTSPYDGNSTPTFGPCGLISYGGESEDYSFTVVPSCSAQITSVTDGISCGPGPVNLSVTGSSGVTSYKWYADATGGTAIATSTTGNWTTPSLTNTTIYYATAINSCESLVRTAVVANVNPIPTLTFTPTNPVVCGENLVIALNAAGDKQQTYLINENFEAGGLGVFTNTNYISNGGVIDPLTNWQNRTSTFVPAQQVWFPAISSGFGTNKFVMSTSDTGDYSIHNAIISPSRNTTNYLDLTLSFKAFYSRYYIDGTAPTLDYVTVDVSTDGGTSWTELTRLISDIGIGTRFKELSFNLNAYVNKPDLKFRILYYGEWVDGIAIDDVKLFGFVPLSTSFSWSSATPVNAFSDAACQIAYSTPVPTVYIKPTLPQLESGSYDFTATATLSNGCSATQVIKVTNTTKIWQGNSTDWNSTANWKPSGIPTSANCVIIPDKTVIPNSNYNAFAKNLTVKSTGNLELPSTSNLTVTDFVKVETNGIFNIRDNASLVQITDADNNTGNVNIERITKPISKLDYTYWSSPVTLASNFTLGSLSSGSPLMFSWIPTIANGPGNWQNETTATIMDPRKGYIVRAPNSFSSSTKTPYTATFKGTPNNGTITAPISKGTLTGTVELDNAEDDEWNLIGNPYPSGIDAAAFLNFGDNIPVIDGTVYIWTHNSQPSTIPPDPFYGDYVLNYTDNDYAVFNSTGGTAIASTAGTFSGFIASGQSFFVKAANTMTPGATGRFATFNNDMRVTGKNSDFFKLVKNTKNESIPKSVTDVERHRIWINLTNNSGAFSQTLLGYVAGATQELDRSFDAESLGGNDVSFYSIIPEAELTIQGRALPFDENDQVTLGYNSEISGELSIRIDHIDGLFDTQNIYLEDKELDVIHNLKEKPYVFNTEIGDFNNRFVLRYADKTLGTDTFNLSNSDEVIVVVNQNVTVQSSNQLIKNIAVYDLLGRKIDSYKKVNALKYTLNHLNKTTVGLIVKITLDNDTVISKKIIY
jgi:hypothetical protein